MPTNRELGDTFAPTFENAERATRGVPGGGYQQPLQTVNFRLPKFSPGGVSPLQSQQMAGSSLGQAVLESVFRTVLGAGMDPAMAASGMPMPSRSHDPSGFMQAPQDLRGGMPAPNGAPQFQGYIDTPPMQNAPPQFGAQGGVDPASWMLANFSDPSSPMGVGDWYEAMSRGLRAPRRSAPAPSVQIGENENDQGAPWMGGNRPVNV